MKKIPTVFLRDRDNDPSLVTEQINPGCEWVFSGEGVATEKIDGTCCLYRGGRLYKRREVKAGKVDPPGFELSEQDPVTGKRFGWVPVGHGPEDRWHREANAGPLPDGTYELVGPKIQGNPYNLSRHRFDRHGAVKSPALARTFEGVKGFLSRVEIEGIVFHHPDGRMAKIKRRDFGLPWPPPPNVR